MYIDDVQYDDDMEKKRWTKRLIYRTVLQNNFILIYINIYIYSLAKGYIYIYTYIYTTYIGRM